jgi:hypothetical protein
MTKADWRRIIAAFAVLAIMWMVGGFIAASNQVDLGRDQELIERNQDSIAELTINVTASLCLQAYAPENGPTTEKTLVEQYVNDQATPISPICRRAIEKAREQYPFTRP